MKEFEKYSRIYQSKSYYWNKIGEDNCDILTENSRKEYPMYKYYAESNLKAEDLVGMCINEEGPPSYESLISNNEYSLIQYDEKSGGLLAIHKNHSFDPHEGHHELAAAEILKNNGFFVILEDESPKENQKIADGLLNDKVFDIKTVLGVGKNNIKNKLSKATRQGAKSVVPYYPDSSLFNIQTLRSGYQKYKGIHHTETLEEIYIVNGKWKDFYK